MAQLIKQAGQQQGAEQLIAQHHAQIPQRFGQLGRRQTPVPRQ
jgi:hypothetical protein